MKLVRIALWIGCILSALPVALLVPLRNYFKIELWSWVVIAFSYAAVIFVVLLAATSKPKKTGDSSSNSEKTT